MEIKTIETQQVYFEKFETTLREIGQYVGNKPAEMANEIENAGLTITGPQIWEYKGADGNPDTKFELNICFPIAGETSTVSSKIKILKHAKFAIATHKGAWENLKHTYCKIMNEIGQKGMNVGSTCREIYHNCDFENQENNITEVQMELS